MSAPLQFASMLVVILVYFGSESLLRRRVYFARIASSASHVVGQMPSILRDPIERSITRRALQQQLEKAEDRRLRAEIHYRLAEVAEDPAAAQRHYEKVVELLGPRPRAAPARAELMVMREEPPAQRVKAYVKWMAEVPIDSLQQRYKLWNAGLQRVGRLGPQYRTEYVTLMARNEVVHERLAEAYSGLRATAARQGDNELLDLARDMERRCQPRRPSP